jgi:hypothetical protein
VKQTDDGAEKMMIVMRKRRDYGEEKRLWEELIACFPFI